MSNARQYIRRTLVAFGLLLTVAAVAEAGPPLICRAFDAAGNEGTTSISVTVKNSTAAYY